MFAVKDSNPKRRGGKQRERRESDDNMFYFQTGEVKKENKCEKAKLFLVKKNKV